MITKVKRDRPYGAECLARHGVALSIEGDAGRVAS